MINHDFVTLQNAVDFQATAATIEGLEIAGPSVHGAYLVKEQDGHVWLFSRIAGKFGRTAVPSVWTELNVAVMNRDIAFLEEMNQLYAT